MCALQCLQWHKVNYSIPKGRNEDIAKKGCNKSCSSGSSVWGLWQNHLGSRAPEWPAAAHLPLREHTQPFWTSSIPCSLPLGVSHGFHCNLGFPFMWWLLGASLKGLYPTTHCLVSTALSMDPWHKTPLLAYSMCYLLCLQNMYQVIDTNKICC